MQMGHMPLIVLVSFSRVLVPTVDFPFRYEPFLCTLSLNLDSSKLDSHLHLFSI
jgi:hypothetical protein